jgi:paraquat-inducible protein B
VFIELTQGSMEQILAPGEQRTSPQAVVHTLVDKGLRAQLQLQSMVTGLLFIEFNFHPDAPSAQVRLDPDTGLPELPTVPTTFQEVTKTVRTALETLGKMPVEELFQKLLATVEGIESLVNSPQVTKTITNLDATITDAKQLIHNIDAQLVPISSDLKATLVDIRRVIREELTGILTDVRQALRDDQNRVVSLAANFGATATTAREALEQMQIVLTALDGAVAPGAPLRYELTNTLGELAAAARSIRVLVQLLEQQPDTVLRGKAEFRTTRGK